MAITLAALAAELQNDPTTLGYAPSITAGNDQGLADMLNLVRGTITVFRNDVKADEVIGATVVSDFTALTAGQQNYYLALVSQPVIDVSNSNVRSNLASLFPAVSATRSNLATLAQRNGSRAEQLWGVGTIVGVLDVAHALGRG